MATDIRAHITGTVWKILVKEGDSVAEGQPLMILESMKMEFPIESPGEGTVTELRVKEGDPVQEDAVVALVVEKI
jgi:acetyl-CoA carboxylase biotin carboxyl carrier protein